MGRVFSRFAILVASASCVFGLAATAVPAGGDDVKRDGPLRALLGEPQFDMQTVFGSQRFPNIVVALDGTVVATWGNQSVRVCRSDDGGQT